jgi:hypothetical protein
MKRTKLELSKGICRQLDGRWSWRLYVFEAGKDIAICNVIPGFIKEFETKKKCKENMKEACEKLGI